MSVIKQLSDFSAEHALDAQCGPAKARAAADKRAAAAQEAAERERQAKRAAVREQLALCRQAQRKSDLAAATIAEIQRRKTELGDEHVAGCESLQSELAALERKLLDALTAKSPPTAAANAQLTARRAALLAELERKNKANRESDIERLRADGRPECRGRGLARSCSLLQHGLIAVRHLARADLRPPTSDLRPRNGHALTLSPQEAAELLGVSVRTLARMAETGELDPLRPSRRKVLYRREQLERYLRRGTADV